MSHGREREMLKLTLNLNPDKDKRRVSDHSGYLSVLSDLKPAAEIQQKA